MLTFAHTPRPFPPAALVAALVTALAVPAVAQDDAVMTDEELFFGAAPVETASSATFRISGGAGYQFGDDEFEAMSAGLSLSMQTQLDRDLGLTVSVGYRITDYDFTSDATLGRDPWGEVHTFGGGVSLRWDVGDDWTVFGGPVFEISRENDADWSDSFIGGGFLGASVQVSDALVIGGGFGLVSQLDDDARLFPVLVLDWEISNDLRLATARPSSVMETPGLELIWEPDRTWEIATGVSFRFHRFRLDDDGVAPAGVGEDSALPLTVRFTYRPNPNFELTGIVGLILEGKVQLENDKGNDLAEEDYDPAGYVGVRGTIRF